jgi:hypothetical protein
LGGKRKEGGKRKKEFTAEGAEGRRENGEGDESLRVGRKKEG